jgi:DNA end-binding protein Ku
MRPIWSGTISFGLVSVPGRMFSATESKELRFHFLHKDDLAPIGYDKVRKDTGEPVDPDDVARGFEIEKGRYMPIEDKEFLDLNRAKAKGRKLPEPTEEQEAEVADLMAALRESVKETKRKRKPARKRARKAS